MERKAYIPYSRDNVILLLQAGSFKNSKWNRIFVLGTVSQHTQKKGREGNIPLCAQSENIFQWTQGSGIANTALWQTWTIHVSYLIIFLPPNDFIIALSK